jgi:hypothetical protein
MAWRRLSVEEVQVIDGLDRAKRFIEKQCETPDGPTREETLEKALQFIARLWPDPGMCSELVPEWVGPNDGRMRADNLWYALNAAREALGLPQYPQPEHWSKPKSNDQEE